MLPVRKIGCWTVRRDIHSIWIILKPALDTDRRWEQLSAVSASHLWVSPCNFPPQLTLINCTQNARFSIPSQYRTGDTYCATRRGIHCSWSVPKPSLDALSWWYLWASLCIFLPFIGLIQTFSTKVDSQNAYKMPNFKYPLSTENRMSFYNDRHPLLMRCFQTFLKCMRQMRGASLCILLFFMGLDELSFTKVGYQIAQNTRWWVRPLSNRMGCHSKRGDIHCLWSVSELSWDTWHRWDELLVESVYQLLVPLGSFLPRFLALKLHTKCHISDTLSAQKIPILWGVELQWETSIAYEAFQHFH